MRRNLTKPPQRNIYIPCIPRQSVKIRHRVFKPQNIITFLRDISGQARRAVSSKMLWRRAAYDLFSQALRSITSQGIQFGNADADALVKLDIDIFRTEAGVAQL